MDIIAVNTKDQLHHFSHEHPLSLVHLQQPNHINKNDDDEDKDGDEDEDEFVEEEHHGGQCQMCNEKIYSFHLCYYYCESCDYSIHKFCAELPVTQQNHPLHPGHDLALSKHYWFAISPNFEWKCFVCNLMWKNTYSYHCIICKICMDIVCATMSDQTIDHPSHPHRLKRMSGHITSNCVACGNKHEGVFFQCTTACSTFRINLDCALLPTKLLIHNHTNEIFTHSHPLSLAFSFPFSDKKEKFYPGCRVCEKDFYEHLWLYKCDKCRYYVHVDCATSHRDPFMSILLPAWLGKTYKNFKEDEYPNLLHCPLEDVGDNLVKRHISNQKELINKQHEGEILNHPSHQHPLILVDKQNSFGEKSVSLHDPMKRIQLLCDGCVKPITAIPFYTCSLYVNEQCCFVLHEWCTKLPSQVQGNASGHPEHALFLILKIRNEFFGVFNCAICGLQSNGFAYGCTMCEYYVDINCAFTPKEITHDAHPDHLLLKAKFSDDILRGFCIACRYSMKNNWGFHCPSCDICIHVECALLFPRVIKNKCDRHPLSLRYKPVENHPSEYFCEICEDEFDPWGWFYHCTTCAQSTHPACAPVICQNEQATYASYEVSVYKFLNVKFGGTLKIKNHSHRLAFGQGLERYGECFFCKKKLQYEMIFKCLECEFAVDYKCASLSVRSSSSAYTLV